jgi:hypothetical protein
MPHARDAPPIVSPGSGFWTWPTEVESSICNGERQDYHKYPKQNASKNQDNASHFASSLPKS